MDNLGVHKTPEVKEELERKNIEAIYAPIYSPDYNPIEFCFSKLKFLVKKMRL